MVYLIHFEQKFSHARHYIGYCQEDLQQRIERHRSGNGSKLMRAVTHAGIPWQVVRVWEYGTQEFERKLKNQHHSERLCPVCNSKLKAEIIAYEQND